MAAGGGWVVWRDAAAEAKLTAVWALWQYPRRLHLRVRVLCDGIFLERGVLEMSAVDIHIILGRILRDCNSCERRKSKSG